MGLKIPDLKPCPYCGGTAYIDILMGTPHIRAHHKKNCCMKPDTWLLASEPMSKQTKAWNMRPKERKFTKWDK